MGGALGKLWAGKGHDIAFGVPDPQGAKAQELVKSIGKRAHAGTVKKAASFGEAVVLATPWPATQDAVQAAGDLAGKVVVYCTNPLSPDLSGLLIGTTTSAGEQVAQ